METVHHVAGAIAVLLVAGAFIGAQQDPILAIAITWLIGELIG